MNFSAQIAKHFRDVYFGGNWTSVNFKDTITGLTWEEANAKVHSFNTIAALVYHMNYYVTAVLKVLQGQVLDAHDKFSFDHPPFHLQQDWEHFLDKVWQEAEEFARLVEQLPESKWMEDFSDKKYGNYYRNIHGIIEHCHYHLGQIVLIKKIIKENLINKL